MEESLLQFVSEPYETAQEQALLLKFREDGYAVLPKVYQRQSVDAFAQQVRRSMFDNGTEWDLPDDSPLLIHPALAPRVRQVLPASLSHSIATPLPAMYMSRWLIQPPDEPDSIPAWHKDREPDGMPGKEYHYPKDVFVGMYFEDMTLENGPTRIIPGSHRDQALLPQNGAPQVDILLQKEDALLFDQRAWHCGTARKLPGFRILVVYGFYAVPLHYSFCFRMPRAQQRAWLKATKRADRVFFGGLFLPPEELIPGR
jgi:hypothetical protein